MVSAFFSFHNVMGWIFPVLCIMPTVETKGERTASENVDLQTRDKIR
jgi:hypothetical protein